MGVALMPVFIKLLFVDKKTIGEIPLHIAAVNPLLLSSNGWPRFEEPWSRMEDRRRSKMDDTR
jgi:hypothetical protein